MNLALSDQVDRLQKEVTMLRLACQAMWQVIKEKTDADEGDLSMNFAEHCDLDGKPVDTNKIITCTKCSRTLQRSAVKCAYCGESNMPATVFDLLARG